MLVIQVTLEVAYLVAMSQPIQLEMRTLFFNFTINYTIDVTDNGAGRLSHTEYCSCLSIV